MGTFGHKALNNKNVVQFVRIIVISHIIILFSSNYRRHLRLLNYNVFTQKENHL